MKILTESKINLASEINLIHEENEKTLTGTMAEGKEMDTEETFLALANKFPEAVFILLDDDGDVCGWRGNNT